MPHNVLALPTKDNATHASRTFYVTHHRRRDPCCAFPFSHSLGVGVGEKPVSLSAINMNDDTLTEKGEGRKRETFIVKER